MLSFKDMAVIISLRIERFSARRHIITERYCGDWLQKRLFSCTRWRV